MNAFDKVIGYDGIKKELLRVCDMIRDGERYSRLGAKLPQGVLLFGDPGLGKSMMAKCFIEECGLPAFTLRKTSGGDGFVAKISETFAEAKRKAPSVVFLDDLDKFANEDDDHADAEEYVAVQAGIDDVKDCGVFVIATVNEMGKLPRSLRRSGRFDRQIGFDVPTETDARKIISYFLSLKKVSPDVDLEDINRMFSYNSCAELETIINEAAVSAGYAGKDCIGMDDLVESVLSMQYGATDDCLRCSEDRKRRTALHEAGHVVALEALVPGSVGLASIRTSGGDAGNGFVHRCKNIERRPHEAIVSLAGKAAVELYYADSVASGCQRDISYAYNVVRGGIADNATLGFGMTDVSWRQFEVSESMNARNEAVTQAELERCMLMSRDILVRNRKLLEETAALLEQKETLLYSDICELKRRFPVVPAAV
ncbi:MAG: AAA family ATPase [Oscillospiraceae bacterium]|nr:AAA family ATPase [Oscillospiraceae bacterium]